MCRCNCSSLHAKSVSIHFRIYFSFAGRTVSITALTTLEKDKLPTQDPKNLITKNDRETINTSKYITIEEFNQQQQQVPNELPKLAKLDLCRPVVVCGLTIKCNSTPNTTDMEENITEEIINCNTQFHCLVVYDFQFSKDSEREENQVKKSSRSDLMSNIVMSMINDIDCSLMDVSTPKDMSVINEVNYNTFKMLNETESNNYQNLIPGESDKIFLPPLPKLEDDLQEEVDASISLLENSFPYINGPVSSEKPKTSEKSISDHITELKNSKTKKLNYSHPVQCIVLPPQYKNNPDLEICEVLPTLDKTHLLIVLRSLSGNSVNVLLVYTLNYNLSVVKIEEEPIFCRELKNTECPIEISVIPSFDKFNVQETKNIDGAALLVCSDGVVRIIDLASSKMCLAKMESNKFISGN